ncbi:uncharacterized protein Bfra_011883 [Botrytis fragariae]|uniref:Uncharacterized protein n=1 Tax=Botrytis fragariae TaxID=1964551 RepID=A0A8H6AKD7_9HELO|nr:uncharacterized protein Bfra_011883 [Botrytis fragariae]KAF5868918.1 hypothetical protein Bfra_011883 [Botrytis fragariae]
MKITHTTYNEVRGGATSQAPPLSRSPQFITTPTAFRFDTSTPPRFGTPTHSPSPPHSNPLVYTTRRLKRYLKTSFRNRTRPVSRRLSRSRQGTSIRYPPGEMHPPTVPTQVGKYHSGSVRGSFSSKGEERIGGERGSQSYERGLETRYKHAKGKKRASYLKPREEARLHETATGLERDFGKGYNGGNSPPSSSSLNILAGKNEREVRNGSPPKFVPREDAAERNGRGEKQGLTYGGMTQLDSETYMKQQRGLERDFAKGVGYAENSPSPPHSRAESPHMALPRGNANHSPIPIPIPPPAGYKYENRTGNTSQRDSVRFSDVQWSSVGSGGSATGTTGTTGTTDSGNVAENSRGRGAGMATGKHKAAPGQRLRRKGKLEERDQSSATTPASSRSQTISKEDGMTGDGKGRQEMHQDSEEEVTSMAQLEAMRAAMWKGKLERVVPPSSEIPKHADLLHHSNPSSTSSRGSKNSKNSRGNGKGKNVEGRASPIQKLKGYMGQSRDAVHDSHEKKTSSKGKLPSPFEYLLYPSYEGKKSKRESTELRKGSKSKSKGKSKEEEDSDDDFWGCVGETNNESGILLSHSPALPSEKSHQNSIPSGAELPKNRKPSEDSWNTHLNDLCKLCRKHEWTSSRGLCHSCEENFLNTKAWEDTTLQFDDDDIPPTPPLKDRRNITRVRDMLATTPPDYDIEYRPPVPAKDIPGEERKKIYVSKVEHSRPQIVNPSPVRHESQMLVYGGMGDSPRDIEIGFPEWQTHSLQIEGAKTEEMFKRWSQSYRGDGMEERRDGDERGKEDGDVEEPRDSVFYDFWGDILKDDGRPGTSVSEERKPKP